MSLDVLTAIWRAPPCKGGDLLCLLAIADNADEFGFAWPSVATIARKAAMGERGAQKCIKKLSEAGLISVKSGGGRNKTNAYQITTNGIGAGLSHINPEQNTPPPSSPFASANPEQSDINPEPAFAKPRTPVHPNSHEPSIEPPIKKERAKPSKRSRMPKDAVLTDRMIEIAEEEGYGIDEAHAQFKLFKGGALANGRSYVDWSAAWRNWFNSQYFKVLTGGHNERPYNNRQNQRDQTLADEIAAAARAR